MPVCRDIIAVLSPIRFAGDENAPADTLLQLGKDTAVAGSLLWCADKNREKLKDVEQGTVILSESSFQWLSEQGYPSGLNLVVVENPRRAFLQTVKAFFLNSRFEAGIQVTAQIHRSVHMQPDTVQIGHHTVIEKDVQIGKNVRIGHNTVILAGTVIADHVSIGSNCTIGGVGFGYEKDENGQYELIPHIGNVEIHEYAEIGNNVCIDRGVLGATRIGRNVKIDNLVHIAHGVEIGENSLVIANAMIAGSARIGKNVWVAPSSNIMQNIHIGDDALIGTASNVLKTVEPGAVMAGNPAKRIR